MGKRGGFPGGFPGGMNINQLMKQAKKMQDEITTSQNELSSKEFVGKSGGDAIQIKLNGNKDVLDIKIKKELVDPEDVEMLEDLLLIAFKDAMKQINSASEEIMGQFNIPGL